jgi:hypothetical protein
MLDGVGKREKRWDSKAQLQISGDASRVEEMMNERKFSQVNTPPGSSRIDSHKIRTATYNNVDFSANIKRQ